MTAAEGGSMNPVKKFLFKARCALCPISPDAKALLARICRGGISNTSQIPREDAMALAELLQRGLVTLEKPDDKFNKVP